MAPVWPGLWGWRLCGQACVDGACVARPVWMAPSRPAVCAAGGGWWESGVERPRKGPGKGHGKELGRDRGEIEMAGWAAASPGFVSGISWPVLPASPPESYHDKHRAVGDRKAKDDGKERAKARDVRQQAARGARSYQQADEHHAVRMRVVGHRRPQEGRWDAHPRPHCSQHANLPLRQSACLLEVKVEEWRCKAHLQTANGGGERVGVAVRGRKGGEGVKGVKGEEARVGVGGGGMDCQLERREAPVKWSRLALCVASTQKLPCSCRAACSSSTRFPCTASQSTAVPGAALASHQLTPPGFPSSVA
eukprot:362472-Chlamydomonas_euryale.AAC.1